MTGEPSGCTLRLMDERRLLMIPGPIELEPDVLRALGHKTSSHVDPGFIEVFGRTLERVRTVFGANAAQPFVLSGSGTLGMEVAAASLVEPGDPALVVETGYFGARMSSLLERLGASVTPLRAEPGRAPELSAIEAQLAARPFRIVTVTHVDTSTGVRAPVREIAALARAHGALCVVDGVCSVGAEALEHDAWGIDCTLTASQKALGAPPGLAVLCFSARALERMRTRRVKVASLYLDALEWLPIMQAYEARKPAYFATPAVNLVTALDASLAHLCAEGMPARVARHGKMAGAIRAGLHALGLSILAEEALASSSITAIFYPEGAGPSLVAEIAAEGVTVAGGLLPELRAKYFRVGHMGAISASDVLATLGAIERGLRRVGAKVELGAGLAAAQRALAA